MIQGCFFPLFALHFVFFCFPPFTDPYPWGAVFIWVLMFRVLALGWLLLWVAIGLQVSPHVPGALRDDTREPRHVTYLSLTPFGPSDEDEDYYVYTTLYSVRDPDTGMHSGGEAIVGQNIAMLITRLCSGGRGLTILRADISPDGHARALMRDFSSCEIDISGRDFRIFLEEILALPNRL